MDVVEKARPIFTKKQYQAAVSEAAPRKTIVGHYLPLILEYQDINTLMIDSGGQGESVEQRRRSSDVHHRGGQ